jgi:hypothetical protein
MLQKGDCNLLVFHSYRLYTAYTGKDRRLINAFNTHKSKPVRVPAGAGNFSLHHRVQTSSGVHLTSFAMGTRSPFPGSKAAGGVKLTTHLHLVPRSKNAWSYTSTPQYAFVAWCQALGTRVGLSG